MFLTKKIKEINPFQFAIFIFGISLLFKDQYSTVAIIILFLTGVFNNNKTRPSLIRLTLFLPSLLLIFRVIGFFTGNIFAAQYEFIRALPLLLLPLPFVFLESDEEKLERAFYYGLLIGAILFMSICNYTVVHNMILNNEPLEYFFRWRHLNTNFTAPIGTHPPYVGMIIVWLFVKTLFFEKIKPYIRLSIILFLSIFLIQILARNAIILCLIVAFYVAVRKFNLKYLFGIFLTFSIVTVLIISHPHEYLREKFFYKLNPFDKEYYDKRFYRLDASIEAFKKSPVFGVGPGNDDDLRVKQYKEKGYLTAYDKRYNSHNQFFEYLVCYGAIGAILFLLIMFSLMKFSIYHKNQSNILIVVCFVLSSMTESVMERSLGIKYFSIMSLLVILSFLSKKSIKKV